MEDQINPWVAGSVIGILALLCGFLAEYPRIKEINRVNKLYRDRQEKESR